MSDKLHAAALSLRKAYQGKPIPPLRDYLDMADVVSAYAIQSINNRHWEEQGRRIVGRKAGLTAKATQAQFGVDQPDYGTLFEDMRIADGGNLDPTCCIKPRAEGEIAFVLGADLPSGVTSVEDIGKAILSVHAAIEIVDSRILDWNITLADTIADNGSSGYFVLGHQAHDLADLDLFTAGMVTVINGEVRSLGAGAAALGHPLNAAAWLARCLASHDMPLRKGDILLTGALGPVCEIHDGDHVVLHVGGLGSCGLHYTSD